MAMMKVRYDFLDGMRSVVCLFVFFGHYFVNFCIEDIFPMGSPAYRICLLVFYGCYTVPLFCAISGFLAVQKELEKGWHLVLAVLNRFLRFELPLLAVIATVMLLNRRGLFSYGDLLAQQLEGKQLAGNYSFESHYTWLFRKPFWSLHVYDNPLWMIGSLFAGNIALYCFSYVRALCRRYLKGGFCAVVQAAFMMILFFLARHDIPMLAVLLGGCYAMARQVSGKTAYGTRMLMINLVASVLLVLMNVCLYFFLDFNYEHFPRFYEWTGLLTALILLHLAFSFRSAQGFLGAKPFVALGGISFAVYVIHYPLIGIFSCPLIYIFLDRLPYALLVGLVFAATFVLCLLLALAFCFLVEKPCYASIKRLIGFLREN